ncbi:MAG: hypothetical protein AAF289_15890 [Cyanobacteria bacterium P01_A01_bin.135]
MLPVTEPGPISSAALPGVLEPDPLVTTSALETLTAILPESLSEADLTTFATDLTGSVTFTEGTVSLALTAPGEPVTESFDIVSELEALTDLVTGISATVGLEDGDLALTGTADEEPLTGALDLSEFTETVILPLFSDIEGELTIDGGVIDIDLGDIVGELSLLDGALTVDLDTPFGAIEEAIAFDEDTEFTVPFGETSATIDLFAGNVTLTSEDPAVEPLELNFTDIPLTLAIDDGLATVEVPGLGSLGEPFDVEQLLSELLTPVVSELDGEFTLADGVLEGALGFFSEEVPDAPIDPTLPLDPEADPAEEEGFTFSVDLVSLLEEASDFLSSLTGTVAFADGVATSTLISGETDLAGDVDLVEFVDEVIVIAGVLDLFGLLDAEEPVAEEPVVEEPVVEEPVVEEPVAEEPVVEEPVVEEPVVEEPVVEEPVVEEPVAEEPVVEEPDAEAPIDEVPAVEVVVDIPALVA